MIRSFADETTRDLFDGTNSKDARRRIPRTVWPAVARKLKQLDMVERLEELRIPPSNRLHALHGDRDGQYACLGQYAIPDHIPVEGHDAYDVCVEDYH